MSSEEFCVIVPVKPPARGKSRLLGLDDSTRAELAEAFALDTIAAARAAERVSAVLVVTDDHVLAGRLVREGCAAIPDGVTGDLNASLVQAAAEAVRRRPAARPVALCADLPALRPDELDAALAAAADQAPDRAAFVPDARGTGTCLYTAPGPEFAPRFGEDSAQAHLAAGAVRLDGEWPHLRRDVDDLIDLGLALGLGVGPATAAAAAHLTG